MNNLGTEIYSEKPGTARLKKVKSTHVSARVSLATLDKLNRYSEIFGIGICTLDGVLINNGLLVVEAIEEEFINSPFGKEGFKNVFNSVLKNNKWARFAAQPLYNTYREMPSEDRLLLELAIAASKAKNQKGGLPDEK